jgi:mannitol/fructose-specific phosphotransferase system IIA component
MTDKKRRNRTVAERLKEHDDRIERLIAELNAARDARNAYIRSVKERAAALTAELGEEGGR